MKKMKIKGNAHLSDIKYGYAVEGSGINEFYSSYLVSTRFKKLKEYISKIAKRLEGSFSLRGFSNYEFELIESDSLLKKYQKDILFIKRIPIDPRNSGEIEKDDDGLLFKNKEKHIKVLKKNIKIIPLHIFGEYNELRLDHRHPCRSYP